MKRILSCIVLLAAGFALTATAQTPAAPAGPAKIAVIAFQAAVAQTNEGQRDFADLQKKFDPKRQHLKGLSDEIENLKKQLQAQGEKLGDAERASRAKSIEEKSKLLQRDGEDAQNDFNQELQDTYAALASKVYDIVSSYSQQNGFTLVLDVSAQQTPVLYASEASNITKAVIDGYNTKSGVPAPPAGTPKPTTPKATAPKAK